MFFSFNSLTLPEVLDQHYCSYSQIGHQTTLRYRCELRRWTKVVGLVPVRRVDTGHFLAFRQACQTRGLSNSSTEGSVKVVKILLRYARDRGWLKSLPMWGKPLPIEEPEPEPASLDELARLYRAACVAQGLGRGSVSPDKVMRAFIVLEYWTGIRGQNLAWRFEWGHIRADHIRFRASKTGKRHTFPLHPIVTEHLRTVHGLSDRAVFGIRWLHRINVELGRMCEAAGIRKLTTTHIREACFTQWTIAGETAGKLVHGCGLPRVLRTHYLGRLQILEEAAPRFRWFESGS